MNVQLFVQSGGRVLLLTPELVPLDCLAKILSAPRTFFFKKKKVQQLIDVEV